VRRPLDCLEQIADVVEAQARAERADVPRLDPEGRLDAQVPPLLRKAEPQALVDDFLEGLAGRLATSSSRLKVVRTS
jgi:hypothetical protein